MNEVRGGPSVVTVGAPETAVTNLARIHQMPRVVYPLVIPPARAVSHVRDNPHSYSTAIPSVPDS
jgi:hypothetical protein